MGVSVIETMVKIMKPNDLSRASRADERVQKLEVHLWVEGLRGTGGDRAVRRLLSTGLTVNFVLLVAPRDTLKAPGSVGEEESDVLNSIRFLCFLGGNSVVLPVHSVLIPKTVLTAGGETWTKFIIIIFVWF